MNSNILVFEDDQFQALAYQSILSKSGFNVLNVHSNAHQLVEKLSMANPDVVLMDIHLNESNGFDAYSEIQHEIDIPWVFMTSDRDRLLWERINRSRAHGLIEKPINTQALVAVLNEVINQHYVSSNVA